jgi:pyruvate kinase
MSRIIAKVESERHGLQRVLDRPLGTAEGRHDALGRAACILAEQMGASAIVTLTHSGQTARVLARYRPDPPVIALTLSAKTLRQLTLVWGVRGMTVEQLSTDSDAALQHLQEELLRTGLVQRGQYVVLLAGQPLFARGTTNFIKVERIGE